MRYTLEQFEAFLKNINLEDYRNRFSQIKTVEMDLPKNIQALDSIYNVYWNRDFISTETPPSFDEYYDIYYNSCQSDIETFWGKTGFGKDCDCFSKGLKARIYRTWASLITQIHGGYVAETVFGADSISQSTELDHKDIDILATYKGEEIKIQIKKESHRPEIGRMHKGMEAIEENGVYNIWYVVPKAEDYESSPFYKVGKQKGELRNSLKTFVKYNPDGTLDRLPNGFVIFTKKEFELIKQSIDNANV